jgi:predicted ATPase
MLRELQIKNFKAWSDSGKIRIAPLTIFCGNNSSGKSSIAQLLLMLKQTVASSDRQRVLHFGEKNSILDLGTYSDIVFNHDTTRNLIFNITFDNQISKINDVKNGQTFGPFSALEFHAEISFEDKSGRVSLDKMKYNLLNGQNVSFTYFKDQLKYEMTAETYQLAKRPGRAWKLPSPLYFYGFPDEAVAYFQNTGFLPDLSLSIVNFFKNFYYIGPLREYPERQYQFSGEIPSDIGKKGENAIKALLASKERKIRPSNKKTYEQFDLVVARWLKDMGLIHAFKIASISEGRKEYEVRIQVKNNSAEVLITDVGFGVSQVLPIIVQCFFSPHSSIVFFEQPEIHLHPSVQSHLGDLFIEAIHCWEDGTDRKNQIIVESHSEHLIRRIQRRIAEGIIDPSEVAVYFVRQQDAEAKIEEMNIDLYGNITNWPENFFGDELEDLAEMTKAARERKKKENHG